MSTTSTVTESGSAGAGSAADAVEALLTAIREGWTGRVPGLLRALGPAERRSCVPALKELRLANRGEWTKQANQRMCALLVAGAGCHPGAAGAAGWIGARDFTGRSWARHPALADVVEAQPVEWQIEVVSRLAAKRGSGFNWDLFPLIERVVRRTGCVVPASDEFVAEWLRSGAGRQSGSLTTLLERLPVDTFTPVLLPRVFELDDVAWSLDARLGARPGDNWPAAIAGLPEAGVFERAELIALCLGRLVRGGRAADQRAFLSVLTALAPTPQEYAARARDLLVLLDGLSAVAGHAQQVLTALDEAGLVEPELVIEASAVVLFRAEKKLVRAQLGWLEQAAKRSPERSGPVALAAADAFGHPDSTLQERALNLVARRLKTAGEAVLPELRLAAEALNPVHHARAGALFGATVGGSGGSGEDDTAWDELLPPVPVPVPLGEPLATPAEVAEELAVLLAAGQPGVAVFERVLDGLVRHAHRDRLALVGALEPVLRVNRWQNVGRWQDCGPADALYPAAVVAGQVDPHRLGYVFRNKGRHPLRGEYNSVYGTVLAARIAEAAERVGTDPVPLLLATPTDTTGALAATALVERLAAYEAAGATAGPADLNAALLRVAPTADPAVLAAAERLTSPAGRWVAAWLRGGGLPARPSERVLFAPGPDSPQPTRAWDRWWESVKRLAVAQAGSAGGPVGPAGERLGPEFRALLEGTEPSVDRARRQNEWLWEPTVHWAAMLPQHREELAARWLDRFADSADRERRGGSAMLVTLAEAGGPAGLALHLALAYCLGARFPEDRTAAVDALLVLAARGDLDGALLGRELGELVALGTVKPNRLAHALATAAETGAYATVWSVLAPALPALLGGEALRGTADLLAVATDAARRSGARGPVPEVTTTAARPGAARLVKEARALRDVLGAA
ncbi:DUF6493 family protein [Kitasatospora misakiensis]|uniref:DUF6493 family protein n=1 Tax=Kitasatospora misakiensis TaxID=67330 RepID=A0ABW0X097_9ACTN